MRLRVAATKSILTLTALAVLLAGQVFPSPSTAFATERTRPFSPFGMASHPMWGGYPEATINAELDALAAAGGRWLRVDFNWLNGEPSKGSYASWYFAKLDYIVAAAAQRDIELEVNVLGTPGWANGNAGAFAPPTNDADYANFIRKLVATYKGRIRYWEIWNEPNIEEFWKPAPDAARYTRMLKAAYTAAKLADPQAVVISAGLSYCDKQYLQEMYDAGARGYFDLLGVHPYTGRRSPYYPSTPYNREWNFDGLADMKATMDANGDTGKHIFASEAGWPTAVEPAGVTEAQQAQYITEAYQRLFEEFPYVDALIIYNVRNNGTDQSSWSNFGLLRRDFSQKLGYTAFKQAAARWWTPAPSVTMQANPAVIGYGRSSLLGIQATPATQTPVKIESLGAGASQWEEMTVTATDAQGTVYVSVTPTSTTSYRAVLPGLEATSAAVKVKVRARATIRTSRWFVNASRAVRISGKVVPAPHSTVVLQRKRGRRWVNVKRVVTSVVGGYSITTRPYHRGRYYYRVRFQGNPSHLGTYSRPVRLAVR